MKCLVFVIYDAFGDWISANGMIRYLSESYDQVYLVHDTPFVVPFTQNMFRDNPKIVPIEGSIVPGYECDVIDLRVNETYPNPGNSGAYYNHHNKYEDNTYRKRNNNATTFYTELGIDPSHRVGMFDYVRDYEKETELLIDGDYAIICEMEDGMIDRKYVKQDKIINLHRLTDNFTHTLKLIENAKEVHLIENSISLFVYHMQCIGKMNSVQINLHTYARKEPHRKCDGPDCNNKFLNMLKCPQLENWNFIWQ